MVGAGASGGSRLDRYTLLSEVASGGMATVFLGRMSGPGGFSRTVAIKRMHAHLAGDPEFVRMFMDEAMLAAKIRHPNVVATLDVIAEGGEVLIVLDHVDGGALSSLIRDAAGKREPLSVALATAIMIGMLAGLDAAHEARGDDGHPLHIVHRDVSPQNVLVGKDGLTRVVDFGVAKARVRSSETADQRIKGKLCYMAPEQVSGRAVDRRADLFAAGAVMFELLAATRLFKADETGKLIAAVIQAEVPALGNYRSDVPAAVEAVMRRALHADPAQRFQTASAFSEALEAATPEVASQRAVAAWVEERAPIAHARRSQKGTRSSTFTPGPLSASMSLSQSSAGMSSGGLSMASSVAREHQHPMLSLPQAPPERGRGKVLMGAVAALVAVGIVGVGLFFGLSATTAAAPPNAGPGPAAQPGDETTDDETTGDERAANEPASDEGEADEPADDGDDTQEDAQASSATDEASAKPAVTASNPNPVPASPRPPPPANPVTPKSDDYLPNLP